MTNIKNLLIAILCLLPVLLRAQSGATGATGGDMAAFGYINYTASFGCDQQIGGTNNSVTIGSGASGGVDIYGALQIDNTDTLILLSGAVLNVYGNITVNGTLAIASGATVNYYGKTWTNGASARVNNNGTLTATPGNDVNFITPRPAVPASFLTNTAALSSYSTVTQMQDLNGNDRPMNIVMHVKNSSNINLITSNTSLSGQLSFDVANGYVITNTRNFTFTATGSHLNAYTDRYIQTNTTTGRVRKVGLAVGQSFFFPVGFGIPNDYTPANVQATSGATDNYNVLVNDFATSTANETIFTENINRTWTVYSELNSTAATSVDLNFIHYTSIEDNGYDNTNSAVYFRGLYGFWPYKYCASEIPGAYGLPFDYMAQSITSVELATCAGCSFMGSGTFFTKSICAAVILPVNLGAFNAALNKCDVQLNWKTYSELNSKAFIIERSVNSGKWKTVSTITAKNKPGGSEYSYIDNPTEDGKIFYRLKMLDADDRHACSSTVTVNKNCTNSMVKVYPNPAQNILHVQVPPNYKNALARLFSNKGELAKATSSNLNNELKINISNLAAGVYLLQVLNNGVIIKTEKIIKY